MRDVRLLMGHAMFDGAHDIASIRTGGEKQVPVYKTLETRLLSDVDLVVRKTAPEIEGQTSIQENLHAM